jgi:predicted murein hydrolase (TIGR00659 family)
MSEVWNNYLSLSPLFGITLSLLAYTLAYRLYLLSAGNPLCNPVLISIILVIGFLLLARIEYSFYFDGAQYIHFFLGPATVALAIPLHQQLDKLKRHYFPIIVAIVTGIFIGVTSSVLIARLFGASVLTQLSLVPKSVTAPIAMGISEQLGGLPSLTAAVVIITGIVGALIGSKLFTLIGITDDSVKGVALGVTAHGIGTARAFQISKEMGAFSGMAMAITALLSALILPWLAPWFF